MAVGLFVLLAVFPVVAAVEPHVPVQGGNVLELPGTDAALHHVLHGVRLRFADLAEAGVRDERVGGLDGDRAASTPSTSLALPTLADELL